MSSRTSRLARTAATLTATAVALAGTVLLGTGPAQAAQKRVETPYGFQGSAYGTRVTLGNDQGDVGSGPTAWSVLGCTKVAPVRHDKNGLVGQVNANDMVDVGAVTSVTSSYRRPRQQLFGSRSVNNVTDIVLGDPNGPRLEIGALRTVADTFARNGKLGAATDVVWSDLEIRLAPGDEPATGTPLDDLVDAVNKEADALALQVVQAAGAEGIEIPEVGKITFGWNRTPVSQRKGVAAASVFALRVDLANGSQVNLSRAWSKVLRDVPAGLFSGHAYASQATALSDTVKLGRLSMQPMACDGTDGTWQVNRSAGVDIPGALSINGLESAAYGVQRANGSGVAKTYSSLGSVNLGDGQLVLQAIRGHANIRQDRSGRIVGRNIQGTSIGYMEVDGEQMAPPTEDNPFVNDDFKVEVGIVDETLRGIGVTAVRITFLDGTGSILNLGNAKAIIRRR